MNSHQTSKPQSSALRKFCMSSSWLSPAAITIATATSLATPGAAMAQDDEILVTATRRAETVQDIPYNISAVAGDELQDTRTFGFEDLSRSLPGVFFLDQGGVTRANNNNFTLRGLNIQSASNSGGQSALAQSAVSTYLGETPLFYNLSLKDLERVEVLRGPQGTLYGAGSLGGTIRFIPRGPELDAASAEIDTSLSFTKDSDELSYMGDAVFNLPLIENTLAMRVAGGYLREGGFVDGLGLVADDASGAPLLSDPMDINSGLVLQPRQEDINDLDKYYVRASFLWAPTENLTAHFRYQHDHAQQDAEQVINPNVPSLTVNTSAGLVPGSPYVDAGSCGPGLAFPGAYFCGAGLPYPNGGTTYPATGERDNLKLREDPYESTVNSYALDVEMDFGFGTLTSATSYYKVKEDFLNEISGDLETTRTPGGQSFVSYYFFYPRFTSPSRVVTENKGFSQELRLVSNWDKPINYVVGAFYQDTTSDMSVVDFAPGLAAWDQANFYYGFNNTTLPDIHFTQDRETRFEDIAIFGEFTYDITERWQITGGVRAFWQELEVDYMQRLPFCGPFCANDGLDTEGTTTVPTIANDVSDQIFKVNTSYDVNDQTMVYFTWAEGFRRGGTNGVPVAGAVASLPEFLTYDPDKATNYEAGVKGTLLDRRIVYTLAGYYIKWKNFQFDGFTPSFLPIVFNGSEVTNAGAEIDLDIALTENFTFDIGYAYTDAKVSADQTILDLPFGGGALVPASVIVDGDPVPNVPKHSLTLAADYEQPISVGNDLALNWHVDGSYRSEVDSTFSPANENFFAIDDFWIWNASVTLASESWDAGLFIRNIGDELGITGGKSEAFSNTRGQNFFTTRPRTIGLSFRYRFQ